MVRDTFSLSLIYSTVQIQAEGPKGTAIGTAFGYSHVTDIGVVQFLVTNKHVVEGATSGNFYFTRAVGDRPEDGPRFGDRVDVDYQNFGEGWHGHPDPDVDIAVFNIGEIHTRMVAGGDRPYFRFLFREMIPDQAQLEKCDVIEDVLFIGYPNGIHDEYNLLPLVRRGITATPPMADYAGDPQVLVDASVFPGSSGSPVFIWDADDSEEGKTYGRPRHLLGILTASMYRTEYGQIAEGIVPTRHDQMVTYTEMLDIGVVLKSSLILETVEDAINTRTLVPPSENWPN